MIPTIQTLVFLLAVIAGGGVVAARLKIPPSILLVLTGVVLALIPGLPTIEIAPEFVLLVVLPPIIYSSAVAMSWREFRFNLRPISLLAVGCVLFTTAATAAATHFLLGLSWPVGFVLGAIVSPPDAVAPLSIARRLQVPRRLLVILEGEGLANDATALVLYRFAVAAVSVGAFSVRARPSGSFAAIVAGEILWGIGVGWLMLRLRRWVGDPRIEITLSILTPFLAYWPPEQLGGSGVLATVTAGLYISWNGLRLISAATRLQGIFFWDFLNYLIEGMVFLITGLQARSVIAGIRGYSMSELGDFRGAGQRRRHRRALRLDVSGDLSAALAGSGDPAQGSLAALAMAVRAVVRRGARHRLAGGGAGDPLRHRERSTVSRPRSHPVPDLLGHPGDAGRAGPAAAVDHPRARPRQCRTSRTPRRPERGAQGAAAGGGNRDRTVRSTGDGDGRCRTMSSNPLRAAQRARLLHVEMKGDGADARGEFTDIHDEIELQLIEAERKLINDLYRDGHLKDEARRRIERELDLREARLVNEREEE